MSSTSSRPTATRTMPWTIPAAWRCTSVRRPCEVLAGWVMVVLVSPRLAVIEQIRVLSMTWNAFLRAAAIGPVIARKSYEVDEGFYRRFLEAEPANDPFFSPGREGHYQFDIEAFVLARLAAAGVLDERHGARERAQAVALRIAMERAGRAIPADHDVMRRQAEVERHVGPMPRGIVGVAHVTRV